MQSVKVPATKRIEPVEGTSTALQNDRMERRVASVMGTSAHYLVGGQGKPLLLIHGIGESNNCWSKNYLFLTNHFTVYAPDLVGWGETEPSQQYQHDLDGLARFILGFMDAVKLDDASVIGWSLGGAATVAAAHMAPHRFSHLMLVAPAGMGRDVHWLMRLVGVPWLGEILLMPTMLTMRVLYKWLYPAQPDAVPREFMIRALEKARKPWHRNSTLAFVRGVDALRLGQHRIDQRAHLSELSMPVHLLWGQHDRVIPCDHGKAIVHQLPRGSLTIFENCGHIPMIEEADRFNNEVLTFLS